MKSTLYVYTKIKLNTYIKRFLCAKELLKKL